MGRECLIGAISYRNLLFTYFSTSQTFTLFFFQTFQLLDFSDMFLWNISVCSLTWNPSLKIGVIRDCIWSLRSLTSLLFLLCGRPAVSCGIYILGQSEKFLFTAQKLHSPTYSLQTYRSHTETGIFASLVPCASHLEKGLLQVIHYDIRCAVLITLHKTVISIGLTYFL